VPTHDVGGATPGYLGFTPHRRLARPAQRMRPWTLQEGLMKTLSSFVLVAIAALPALAAAQATPSADLRTLCPGAEQALQAELARAWHQGGYPATVRVQMRVDGQRVDVGALNGGRVAHRYAVARAVSRLDCNSVVAGGQPVDFEVRFVAPDQAEATTRMASR